MSANIPEFTISREFAASREKLWNAWTNPQEMAKWWGPKGFTVGKYNMDFRPGGTYLYSIKSPEGFTMWGKFTYREITAPEKLVFINSFSDENGGITRHPLSPTWPQELLSTITFAEKDGKTTITVRWTPHNANEVEIKTFADGMASMVQGWGGTFDQLGDYLKNSLAPPKS